jgi:hypothetical protein
MPDPVVDQVIDFYYALFERIFNQCIERYCKTPRRRHASAQ